MVLKKCEPELFYILGEHFNRCLKESYFPDCWKVSSVSLYLRMLGKGVQLKTTALLVVLSVASKVFEKLVINRIVDHLKNVAFFPIFRMV